MHFYRSVLDSIICCGITVWGTTSGEKDQLERVVTHASRILGRELHVRWRWPHCTARSCVAERARSSVIHRPRSQGGLGGWGRPTHPFWQ